MKDNKVIVGLSGGVDSAVTAALLKKRGFDVRGVFMKNWHSDDPKFSKVCPWEDDLRDARTVAAKLEIPFDVWNFEKEYHDRVVDYFFDEYRRGRTPNPDVMCNKEIKFKVFLEKALKRGADYVATGHYARLREIPNSKIQDTNKSQSSNSKKENSNPLTLSEPYGSTSRRPTSQLLAGKDPNKDQSYFLWAIDRKVLPKLLMPIGDYTKPQVRRMASDVGLPNAAKKDSQGICFIGPINVCEYLKTELPEKRGRVINEIGETVGRHDGVWFYTEGQRSGVGSYGGGLPYYIVKKDIKKNLLYVAPRRAASLFAIKLIASQLNWLVASPLSSFKTSARIRYRHELVPVKVKIEGQKANVEFVKPQRAITPGQSIVFYDNGVVLGGGVIDRAVL